MALEVKDLAGFSEPMKKLIEVVSSGLGSVFQPRARRADADARAYEIKAIARAQAEANAETGQIELQSALQRIKTIGDVAPELVERARQRLLAREIEGQLNVEAIAEVAAQQLPNAVSADPVSANWRRKFFMEAENICDADMQLLWGKVLAGELTKPGTYSTRALETLRQLTSEEAEIFRKACCLAMDLTGWIALPDGNLNIALKPYGVSYGEILHLRDAGLVMAGDNLGRNLSDAVTNPKTHSIVHSNNGVMFQISGPGLANMTVPVIELTQAGRELRGLVEFDPHEEYLKALAAFWRKRNVQVKRGISVPEKEAGVSVITFEQDL